MFHDRLVTNRALQDYKKGLFGEVAILEFFQMGIPFRTPRECTERRSTLRSRNQNFPMAHLPNYFSYGAPLSRARSSAC